MNIIRNKTEKFIMQLQPRDAWRTT